MSANKQIVSDAYEALAAGEVKGFLAILDPEIEVSEPSALPYGGRYHGVSELLGMFKNAAGVLDSSRTTVESLTAEDDRVVAVLRIPVRTGEEAVISEHWRLRDGKAVSLDVFWADTSIVS